MKNEEPISADQIYELLEQIDKDLGSGEKTTDQAKELLLGLLSTTGEPYFVLLKLAEIALIEFNIGECRTHTAECESIDPSGHRHQIIEAILLEQGGEYKKARSILKQVDKITADDGNAYFSVLCCNLEGSKADLFRKAVSLMTCYMTPDRDNLKGWIHLCMDAKLIEEGLFLSHQLLGEDPKSWVSYIGPAFFYELNGQRERALEFLSKAEGLAGFRNDEFVLALKERLAIKVA